MAELKLIKNGSAVKNARRKTRKRRRNPVSSATVGAVATAANGRKRKRRRNPATSTALVANPRRKSRRRRRNGILTARNGVFGNSKETVRSTLSLLGGLVGTKIQSQLLSPLVAKPLSAVGMQGFAKPITEIALSVTVNPWIAKQLTKSSESAKFVMIGGLAMAVMHLVESFLPQTSPYNPFATVNTSPVLVNTPAAITTDQIKQLVNAAQQDTAAKVAGALDRARGNFVPQPVSAVRRPSF